MTSAEIIEAVRQELIDAGRNIIDPAKLTEWCNQKGILAPHLSAAIGCSEESAVDKLRAGNPFRETSPEAYEFFSRPLTKDNFPGDASNWMIHRPDAYIIDKLSEALDGAAVEQLGLVQLCYKDLLGRDPDGEGFQHYQDRLDAGEPIFEIIRDIELSPEATARKE